MSEVLLGNDFKVQIGDGNSPQTFTDFCAAYDFGSVGEEKPLVDITGYCDDARAYRNGLADGVEIPLACNFKRDDTIIGQLYGIYKADTVVTVRIAEKNSSPESYFEFQATIRAWNLAGPIGERASITFTLKISGEVTWV